MTTESDIGQLKTAVGGLATDVRDLETQVGELVRETTEFHSALRERCLAHRELTDKLDHGLNGHNGNPGLRDRVASIERFAEAHDESDREKRIRRPAMAGNLIALLSAVIALAAALMLAFR